MTIKKNKDKTLNKNKLYVPNSSNSLILER